MTQNPFQSIDDIVTSYATVLSLPYSTKMGSIGPFVGPFDYFTIGGESVADVKLCRWCRAPVEFVDWDLNFIESCMYHLEPEQDEACEYLRSLIQGGRL